MEVELPAELAEFVRRKVAEGHYRSADSVVRAALEWFSSRDRLLASTAARSAQATWQVLEDLDGTDIEEVAFQVLMEAAKSANEDLQSIMAHVKAINAAKSSLRQLISKVARDISANLGQRERRPPLDLSRGMGSARAYHHCRVPHPDPETPGGVQFLITDLWAGRLEDVSHLKAIRDELDARLDSLGELTDMTSIRLQMLMERRTRVLATLSNLLKKMSDTEQAISQNLK
jgi:putative addiction module CopG family antidote